MGGYWDIKKQLILATDTLELEISKLRMGQITAPPQTTLRVRTPDGRAVGSWMLLQATKSTAMRDYRIIIRTDDPVVHLRRSSAALHPPSTKCRAFKVYLSQPVLPFFN